MRLVNIHAGANQIEFRRIDKPKDPNTPAKRVDVMLLDLKFAHDSVPVTPTVIAKI